MRSDETQRAWALERELQDGMLERAGTLVSVSQSGLLAQRRGHAADKLSSAEACLRPPLPNPTKSSH